MQAVVDWVENLELWRVAGRWDPASHVGALSLIVPDALSPHDVAAILDTSFDIAVRPGLHCALYIHRCRRVLFRRVPCVLARAPSPPAMKFSPFSMPSARSPPRPSFEQQPF